MKELSATSAVCSLLALTLVGCGGGSSSSSTQGVQTTPAPNVADGTKLDLAVLGTTDIHTNVMSYDYYKTTEDKTIGFERTATLIDAARKENPNNLLLDDGDTIQGTSLGDYQALVNPVACGTKLAVYKAMSLMGYDAGNIGNHEFNYGLPFLSQVTGTNMRIAGADNAKNCAGPGFPLVLSNALNKADNQPIFKPYVILDRTFKTADGTTVPLKVGVIGFTPTQITMWDKLNLDGKVVTQSAKDAADKYIPEMKKAGADIVIAVAHGGIDDKAYVADTENPINYISTVPGVTAIVSGHSHSFFPDGSNYSGLKNIDNKKGLVNGIPTVMAGFWGKALGVIKLNLQYDAASKAWKTAPTSYSELKYINPADDKTGNTKVAPDAKPEIGKLIEAEHKATIDFVNSPVGTSELRISSFFAQVGPTAAMRLINLAQIDYVKTFVKNNLPQYANLPVLSAAAPFKVNFRGTGFTDIAAGPVAIKNVADLYLYPNTLQAVKITGNPPGN